MLTGLAVPTLADRPLAMQCSSGIIWCSDPPSVNTQSLGRVQRPSIALWQMVSLKLLGCVSYSWSFATLLTEPHWSTVTTLVPYISPPTQSSISARSTLRLISTLFGSGLPSARYIRVLHVPTTSQYADVFIKGLPTSMFQEFRSSVNVRRAPNKTAGEC